jgi:hypothetical protein
MDQKLLTPSELAAHWSIKRQTLQKWRTKGYGPRYLKISNRILYPMQAVLQFQKSSLQQSTAQNPVPETSKPLTSSDVAFILKLPTYWFLNTKMRQKLNIPYVTVNKEVRFKLNEVKAWARQYKSKIKNQPAETHQTGLRRYRGVAIDRLSLI